LYGISNYLLDFLDFLDFLVLRLPPRKGFLATGVRDKTTVVVGTSKKVGIDIVL
jgi:hypothetical protein